MEFSQLKQEYKILGEILKWYDTLNQPVVEEEQYKEIFKLCDKAPMFQSDTTGNYLNFCKKLSRNLFLLKGVYNDDFKKRCSNLYVWLYYEIMNNTIPNDITESIFNQSINIIQHKLSKTPCPYLNFNEKHQEPTKLMKLSIFNDNADTFQGMLKGEIKSDDCSLKRYVYKCIEVYREMNSKYCSIGGDMKEENRNSCNIIRNFNSLYTSYIHKQNGIHHKFPELSSNTNTNIIEGCPPEVIVLDQASTVQSNESDRSIIQSVSPALGFTPARKLFRFGNKKHTIITGDFDNNMENELFHAIKEDSNIKDIHPRYNIGYEPI
ncbi:hypothetical protein PVIIG_05194 [Plasmodium vivax India VII]|uniref:PIR Superfamily Protein n=1 Tax=Plasmodium vivax India VII TaxID=1077284 RepID=A0A0J9S379_PLAVI|nr:hypothetical protein PVIIG_05194 [Plasmodium vivax India VII]